MPACQHPVAVRWGQSGGLPRWRCKGCRKTFNPLTATPLARLRFRERWMDHAEALANGDTLREVADRCGIHRNTAHRWRRRFPSTWDGFASWTAGSARSYPGRCCARP